MPLTFKMDFILKHDLFWTPKWSHNDKCTLTWVSRMHHRAAWASGEWVVCQVTQARGTPPVVFEGAACPSHNDHACFSAYPVSPKRRLNPADKASRHPQPELLAVAGVFGWFVHVPSWPSPRNSFHLEVPFTLEAACFTHTLPLALS